MTKLNASATNVIVEMEDSSTIFKKTQFLVLGYSSQRETNDIDQVDWQGDLNNTISRNKFDVIEMFNAQCKYEVNDSVAEFSLLM